MELNFTHGVQEYTVHGVGGDVAICFNPTDGEFVQRLYHAVEVLDKKQDAYNKAHGIVPQTIRKSVRKVLEISHSAEEEKTTARRKLTDAEREATIRRLEKEMKEASKMLEFEYAALLRDQIIELRGQK